MAHIEIKDQITQQKTIETPKSQSKKFYLSSNKTKKQMRSFTSEGKRNLWAMSASTMTRDDSPSYRIPKSQRFFSPERERCKNQSFLYLNLRKELEKGTTFPKSERKNHFVNKNKYYQPSSATYFKDSHLNHQILQDETNPQLEQKLNLIGYGIKKYNSTFETKGVTFNQFDKYHTQYLHHARQMNYQPETTRHNPGVGLYSVSPDQTKIKNPSFTFRKVLTRFNESIKQSPGPSSYLTILSNPHKTESINQKGTFENSNRIFLQKPNNGTPGPGAYLFDE